MNKTKDDGDRQATRTRDCINIILACHGGNYDDDPFVLRWAMLMRGKTKTI